MVRLFWGHEGGLAFAVGGLAFALGGRRSGCPDSLGRGARSEIPGVGEGLKVHAPVFL